MMESKSPRIGVRPQHVLGLFVHCDHFALFLLIATMEGDASLEKAGSRRGAWPAPCSTTTQFRGFDDVDNQADLMAPPTAIPL